MNIGIKQVAVASCLEFSVPRFSHEPAMNGLNKMLTDRVSHPKPLPQSIPPGRSPGSKRVLRVIQPLPTFSGIPSLVLTNDLVT